MFLITSVCYCFITVTHVQANTRTKTHKCTSIIPRKIVYLASSSPRDELKCLHEKIISPPPRYLGLWSGISGGRAGSFPSRFHPVCHINTFAIYYAQLAYPRYRVPEMARVGGLAHFHINTPISVSGGFTSMFHAFPICIMFQRETLNVSYRCTKPFRYMLQSEVYDSTHLAFRPDTPSCVSNVLWKHWVHQLKLDSDGVSNSTWNT